MSVQTPKYRLHKGSGQALVQINGGGTTLNVTAATAPVGQPAGLTLGAVTLGGNVTINVANNTNGGSALGTLTLDALNDSLAPATSGGYTITLGGAGAVTLSAAATSLVAGTIVDRQQRHAESQRRRRIGLDGHAECRLFRVALALGANQTVDAFNGAGTVNLAANGSPNTLTIGSTDNLASNFSGSITDAGLGGSLRVKTTSTVTLAGANTYTGDTTISSGTLQLGDGVANNGSVAGNIIDDAALVFADAAPQIYGGGISGSGTVTVNGLSTLTLTGSNSYIGNTNVTTGALTIGATARSSTRA